MRSALVATLVAFGVLFVPASAFALGIGISTPSVTLTNFGPGLTASGTGAVVVTGVLTPWVLKVSDPTNAGHLVPGAIGCADSESHTVNGLSVRSAGVLPTTASAGTLSIGTSSQTLANGAAVDTVNLTYSLDVARTEVMRAGCVFSTTVTFTVQ
jgi:hypothetical protein